MGGSQQAERCTFTTHIMNSGATRASIALALAFTAALAVLFVVSTQSEESTLLRSEGESSWTEADKLSYFHDAEHQFAQEKAARKAAQNFQNFLAVMNKKALQKADKVLLAKTLKNICKLRAYAELAYDKANDLKLERASADTGLLGFILGFAKEAVAQKDAKEEFKAKKRAKELTKKQEDKNKPKIIPDEFYLLHNLNYPVSHRKAEKTVAETAPKPYTYNVIVDYAKAVAAAEHVDKRGFNKYLIDNIAKAVKKGEDLTYHVHGKQVQKDRITFNFQALGFTEEPYYFRKIGVSPGAFASKLAEVEKASVHADVLAATLWLNQGANNAYMSFLDKEVSKANAIKKANFDAKVKAALKAITVWYRDRGSWKKLLKSHENGKQGPTGMGKVLRPLVHKGIEGATDQSVNDKPVPTYETMKKAATGAAKSFMKKHKLDKKIDLVDDEIDSLEGKKKKKEAPKPKPKPKAPSKPKAPTKPKAPPKPKDYKVTPAFSWCQVARRKKLEYLDRQHLVAFPADNSLSGFHLTGNGCKGDKMRYQQWSIATPKPVKTKQTKETACTPFVGKQDEYLDRQWPNCGNTGTIRAFKVTKSGCGGGDKRYQYECNYFDPKSVGKRVWHKTNCAKARHEDVEFLDRQDVKCPKNSALGEFGFEGKGCGGNVMRYSYACLELKP